MVITPDLTCIHVLLVDDDEEDYFITRELLSEIETTRFKVTWLANPDEALQQLDSGAKYDICLLDYRMGRRNGLDVLQEIVAAGHTLPIILLTGQDDSNVDREAVRLGASDYLVKGQADAVLLERSIRYAIRQKNTEEAIRKQTQFVSAVLDTASALVIVLDREGRIVRFNKACEQVTGYPFSEVFDRPFFFLVPAEERDTIEELFSRLIAGNFPYVNENTWLTREGKRRRITFTNTCLTDREGNVEFIVATGIDVTEQRRTEAALAEARDRELEVGASIQKTLLVRNAPTEITGIEFGAHTQAAQRVGGDYLDFFVYDDHCIDVLVGDVMGKGVPAALLAAATKSQFQHVVRRLVHDLIPFHRLPEPQEIVDAVHHSITPELYRLCSFVTLNYARFDLRQRTITYVDCGHPGLLYLDAQGNQRTLSGTNVPLGMSLVESYQQITVPFVAGDLFFFFSDGLYEATDRHEEQFSMERLLETVHSFRQESSQTIAEEVCRAVDAFAEGGTVDDDRTCIVVKIAAERLPEQRLIVRREFPGELESLEAIRRFVEEIVQQGDIVPLSEDDIFRVLLAVHEAAANIVRHAYAMEDDNGERGTNPIGRYIQVTVQCFDDRITVELHDAGGPFENQTAVPAPVFDGTREGGFGIFLIREAVDEVSYRRDDFGRNAFCLVKRFDHPI